MIYACESCDNIINTREAEATGNKGYEEIQIVFESGKTKSYTVCPTCAVDLECAESLRLTEK